MYLIINTCDQFHLNTSISSPFSIDIKVENGLRQRDVCTDERGQPDRLKPPTINSVGSEDIKPSYVDYKLL